MQLQILNSSNEQTMSSKEIAEYTNKRHDNVMRDIDSFVQSFGSSDLRDLINHGLMIEAKEELNVAANRKTRIYYLNKKAALLVTSGYDVHLRLKIINRWEELENQAKKTQVPETFLQAMERVVEIEKQRLLAVAKADSLQITLDESKEWMSIKRIAKLNDIPWREISWRKLKNAKASISWKPKKIFDANYGEVNIYHTSAWEEAYPELELPLD
jgi:phage regulator Rha-like protein